MRREDEGPLGALLFSKGRKLTLNKSMMERVQDLFETESFGTDNNAYYNHSTKRGYTEGKTAS